LPCRFSVWTLRGLHHRDPEGARGGSDGRRLDEARRLRPDPCSRSWHPGLVATSVFAFITSWNEYIFARILLNDQGKQTVTVWLSYFLGTSRHQDWGALMAGSTLTANPPSSSSSCSCSGGSCSG